MKKELVINVIKNVGPVVLTGLSITAVGILWIKERTVRIKVQEIIIDDLLEINKKLSQENQLLRESTLSKKKKV